MKKRSGDWHPEDIKAAVRKRGWTLKGLARTRGLPINACQQACSHPRYHGELAIADVLGVSAATIWPSRFDGLGNRKHQRRTRKASAVTPSSHRQNERAA